MASSIIDVFGVLLNAEAQKPYWVFGFMLLKIMHEMIIFLN